MFTHIHTQQRLKRKLKRFSWQAPVFLFTLFLLFYSASILFIKPVYAAQTYDLSNTSEFNIRFDGAEAGDKLREGFANTADFDGDGLQDMIIGTTQNHLYLIYGSLLSELGTKGTTIDLNDPGSYNIKFDGAFYDSQIGDLDNDGKPDIQTGAYTLYNTLIDNYTGTGNVVDITQNTNHNLHFSVNPSAIVIADINNDGRNDLLLGNSSYDSYRGQFYVIYNSILESHSGLGQDIDLSDTANYSLRYTGANAADNTAVWSLEAGDLDNDGKSDIVVGSLWADNNGLDRSGSAYVICNDLISQHTTAGTSISLSDSSEYCLRIDGAKAIDLFPEDVYITDLDGDGRNDLIANAHYTDPYGRTNAGSVYVFYNSLLNQYLNTGTNLHLDDSSSYNLRFDGEETADDNLGYLGDIAMLTADFDGDGKEDLFLGSPEITSGGKLDSGAVYVIYNTTIDDYTGTGNQIDMAVASNYNHKYEGPHADSRIHMWSAALSDLNNDGTIDIMIGAHKTDYNGRADSGSHYVIYNFPHSISLDSVSSPTNSSSVTVTGSISATNSVTNVSNVQYSVDSSSFSGTWNGCSASDGSFDSTSEGFSCSNIDISSLSDGSHTVYLRAYDANTSYTAISRYGSVGFTIDVTKPTLFELDSPADGAYTNSERPTFRWRAASTPDTTAGLSEYKLWVDNGDGGDFTVGDIPPARNVDLENNKYRVQYEGFDDSDSSNNYISVYTKSSSEWGSLDFQNDGKLKEGKRTWTVTAIDEAGNERSVSRTLYVDLTSPSKPSLTNIGTLTFNTSYTNWYYTSTKPTFRGTAGVGSTVTITISSDTIEGTTTTDSSGNWEYTPASTLATGTHKVSIKVVDQAGNQSGTLSFNLTIDPTASSFPQSVRDLIGEPETVEEEKVEEVEEATPSAAPEVPSPPKETVSEKETPEAPSPSVIPLWAWGVIAFLLLGAVFLVWLLLFRRKHPLQT